MSEKLRPTTDGSSPDTSLPGTPIKSAAIRTDGTTLVGQFTFPPSNSPARTEYTDGQREIDVRINNASLVTPKVFPSAS